MNDLAYFLIFICVLLVGIYWRLGLLIQAVVKPLIDKEEKEAQERIEDAIVQGHLD